MSDDRKNIKVVCRVRPLNQKEQALGTQCIQFAQDKLRLKDRQFHSVTSDSGFFTFDQVFDPACSQQHIFQKAALPLVDEIFQGVNVTVFAYGQTSSGKTYTMQGYGEEKGLIPRLLQSIFLRVEGSPSHIQFRMKVSVVEIYMQKIKDIIEPQKSDLRIRESKTLGIYIENVTEVYVSTCQEVLDIIQLANTNRAVAATNMNDTSSRSHLLFIFSLFQNDLHDLSAKSSKVYLVDLAGSQKVSKTGAQGKVLDQAKGINKSLSALGNVINALTQSKGTHVPYRDSKLTRILQESLGGNSRTVLVITCSPSDSNAQQTISTLRFGLRAKSIKNKPKVNREFTVQQLMILLQKAQSRIKQLERANKELESKLQLRQSREPSEKSPSEKSPGGKVSILSMVQQLQNSEESKTDQIMLPDMRFQAQLKSLSEQLEKANTQLTHAQRNAEIQKSKKEQFSNQLQLLLQRHLETQALLQQKHHAIQTLELQMKSLSQSYSSMNQMLTITQTPPKSNQDFQKLLQKTLALEESLERLRISNSQKQTSLAALVMKIQQFSMINFGEQTMQLTRSLTESVRENERLRVGLKQLQHYQTRIQQFKAQKVQLQTKLSDRVRKIPELQEELDNQRQESEYLRSLIRAEHSEIEKFLSSLQSAECLKGENEKLRREVQFLKESLQVQKNLIKVKQEQINYFKSKQANNSGEQSHEERQQTRQQVKRMVKVFSSTRFPALSLS